MCSKCPESYAQNLYRIFLDWTWFFWKISLPWLRRYSYLSWAASGSRDMSSQSWKKCDFGWFLKLWELIALEPDVAQEKYGYRRNQGKEIFQKNQVSIQKKFWYKFWANGLWELGVSLSMYCIYAFRNVSTLCVSCKFQQSMRSRQNQICNAHQMLSKDYASNKIPKVKYLGFIWYHMSMHLSRWIYWIIYNIIDCDCR